MAEEQSPIAGFSHQEKSGFLRVTPSSDKPVDKTQPTSAQPPPKTGKRPFGGGEILGEPLIKRSRFDEHNEARRSQERRPRELDPAMLTKHFTMANKKEIEEVKARIATTTPSNPTGIPPRSTRHAEPVPLSMTTGKPIVSKSLRDAPPLPRDTSSKERRDAMVPRRENTSKPRQDPSAYHQERTTGAHRDKPTPTPTPGTKANPISFSSGLHALDREFRSGSGYYPSQQDDDDALSLISSISLSEGPRGPDARRGHRRDGPGKGYDRYGKDCDHYQPPRRTTRSEERRRQRGLTSGELERMARRHRTMGMGGSCDVSPRSGDGSRSRSRSRTRSRSLVKRDDRYRGEGHRVEKPRGRSARLDCASSRRPPPVSQRPREQSPPPSGQVRREEGVRSRGVRKSRERSRGADRQRSRGRERSPERKRSRQRSRGSSHGRGKDRRRSRDRRHSRPSQDRHHKKRRSRSHNPQPSKPSKPSKQPRSDPPHPPPSPPSPSDSFFGADEIPEPHESLGVDEGEYTQEQEMALFDLAVTVYVQRERVAELMLNRTRLQFDLDNRRKREEGEGKEGGDGDGDGGQGEGDGGKDGDGDGNGGGDEEREKRGGDGAEKGSKERSSRERGSKEKDGGGSKERS